MTSHSQDDDRMDTPISYSLTLEAAREDFADLSNTKVSLQENMAMLVSEQSNLLKTRSSSARRQVVDQELEELESESILIDKQLERLQKQIRKMAGTASHPASVALSASDIDNASIQQEPPEPLNKFSDSYIVPRMLPTFGQNSGEISDPEEFISKFSKVLRAHGLVEEYHWYRLIFLCLNQQDSDWYTNTITSKSTWDTAKAIFINHFAHPLRNSNKIKMLWTMKHFKNESLQHYCDRFQNLMRECSITDSVALTELFISTLPSQTQRDIRVASFANPSQEFLTISKAASIAIAMESTIIPYWRPDSNNYTENNSKTEKISKNCVVHGKCNHSTSECNKLKLTLQQDEPKIKLEDEKISIPYFKSHNIGATKCFTCGESGHKSPNCKMKKNSNIQPVVKLTRVKSKQDNLDNENEELPDLTLDDYERMYNVTSRMARISENNFENDPDADAHSIQQNS